MPTRHRSGCPEGAQNPPPFDKCNQRFARYQNARPVRRTFVKRVQRETDTKQLTRTRMTLKRP
jgi:hypothetical protein